MNVVDRKGVTFTQKDIAEALGYAQSTVATALSPGSRHKLSPDIVERIQKYADKIGYRPQRFAQILKGKKSRGRICHQSPGQFAQGRRLSCYPGVIPG